MKVLLVAVGSHGDVHPLIGLGAALRGRGHRVLLAANEHFRVTVERVGLEFHTLGTEADYQRATANPDLWHPMRAFPYVMREAALPLLRPTYRWLAEEYEPGRTVAAAHSLAFGARVAQEALGMPLATVHLQPIILRSAHEHPVLPGVWMPERAPLAIKRAFYWLGDRVMIDRVLWPIMEFRESLGMRPVKRIMKHWWHSPQRVIGLFPDWFAAPQPDWPPQTRLTGFPLYDEAALHARDAELEQFLADGPAPVAFTAGSAMRHGESFFRESIEACGRIGCRVLLLARHTEQLPKALPRFAHHSTYAPFSQVLPKAAVFVHHGGIGTCAQGLAAGVPQLVMPLAHDQPDNAMRLRRLGVGKSLPPRRYRAARVAAMLQRMLKDHEMRRHCEALAPRARDPQALIRACELIERLAGHDQAVAPSGT